MSVLDKNPLAAVSAVSAELPGEPERLGKALLAYGIAIGSVVLATLARLSLDPILHNRYAFATYFLAVALAAWAGGFWPATLATLLSALAAAHFFIPPDNSLAITDPADIVALTLFIAMGLALAGIGESHRKALHTATKAAHATASILESITDAFVAIDRLWRFRYVNARAQEILGKRRDELLGKVIWDIFPTPEAAPGYQLLHTAMRKQVTMDGEYRSVALNAWLHVRAFPNKDGLSVFFEDVTARREAAEEEKRTHELLGITLRSIGDAVISTDADGRITFMNPLAQELTGWREEQAHGQSSTEVFHIMNEASRAEVESPIERVIREGITVGLANHTVLISRDGFERPIDDSGAPILADDGRLLGVVLVFRDITERRRAEAAYQRLAAIVDSSSDAIYGKTLDGIITSWNPGAEQMYGYSADEVIGKPVSLLIPADRPDEMPALLERIRRGEAITHYQTERVCKDGRRIQISKSISPIHSADGEITGASSIARDITDQKRAEEERRQHLAEIEALNTRLQRAMSETHHRVKNNLQVITALLNLLTLQHPEAAPVSELNRVMQHIRALATIHDLLTQQAKIDAEVDDLSIQEAMEKLLPLLQDMVADRPIRFQAEDDRLPIRQTTAFVVLVNELISNAIKHGTGEISITFTVADGKGRLEVQNEGSGFPDGFDPKASANTGLELVESVARWDLQGTTRYENRDGGGARVIAEFPMPA